VTIGRDGTVRASRKVEITTGRRVAAYITDGRDRSPYAACRAVRKAPAKT